MKIEHLIKGKFYHVYNRGNNKRNLFAEAADYEHFLSLYDKYITPVAETFAWVLMPNHFHLLVQIKENIVYKYSGDDSKTGDDTWFREHKWETIKAPGLSVIKKEKQPVPHRHFAHLFNAYTRHYNKKTGGSGNLFERPFKRKEVSNKNYLKMLIVYIHNNPVHHGFCSHPIEYPWSGYLSCISDKETKLNREAVIQLFGNKAKFDSEHGQDVNNEELEKWLNLNSTDYVTEIEKNEKGSFNADMSSDAVRLEDDNRSANLSACATPDNVKEIENKNQTGKVNADRPDTNKIAWLSSVNADRSKDAVRLKENNRSANLSAFNEPDNVKKAEMMNRINKVNADRSVTNKIARLSSVNADRSKDAVRLKENKRSANLSAFAIPDNVKADEGTDNVKIENRRSNI